MAVLFVKVSWLFGFKPGSQFLPFAFSGKPVTLNRVSQLRQLRDITSQGYSSLGLFAPPVSRYAFKDISISRTPPEPSFVKINSLNPLFPLPSQAQI